MEFLSTKGMKDDMSYFMRTLKEVEINFSNIIDAEALFNSTSREKMVPSRTLMDIVNTMEVQNVDRAMAKLRESIRIMRANRLSVFSELSEIEKLLEVHKDITIVEMLERLTQFAEKMVRIPNEQITPKFKEAAKKLLALKESTVTIAEVTLLLGQMREAVNYDIKPREFSVENFWRGIAKIIKQEP